MAFKMKGSPLQRNFGIGSSPMKDKQPYDKSKKITEQHNRPGEEEWAHNIAKHPAKPRPPRGRKEDWKKKDTEKSPNEMKSSGFKSALKQTQTSVVSPLQQEIDQAKIAHVNEMIADMKPNSGETAEEFKLRRRAEGDYWGKDYDRQIADAEKDQLRREELHRTKDTDPESKKIIDKSMGYNELGEYVGVD